MRTCSSFGQPYRSKCASFGQAAVGEMTALLTLVDPRSSCNTTASAPYSWLMTHRKDYGESAYELLR